MSKYSLKICHLYPDLLNLYGDRGNILALSYRAGLRDIDTEIVALSMGQSFEKDQYDIVFFGGGQDAEQKMIRRDLVTVKGEAVKEAVEEGMVFLCICGGYQMMGHYYQEQDGEKIDCLGALNVYTEARKQRFIGNTEYRCELPINDPIIYGFENHSGRTYLGDNVRPLAKVVYGKGNNGEDGTEGAVYKNVIASYSHGSLLPKNPELCDYILTLALKRRFGEDFTLKPADNQFEEIARKEFDSCKK
ncbi:MAG: glutamine amidotransferase [Clostridiaceae bacterium]|nr:glutamine amidotransferase [Clostridiaceae bacterium]